MSKNKLYRYTLLLAIAGAVALLVSPGALAQSPRHWWHPRPRFSVTLVGANGEPLRTFGHNGQIFVLGEPGVRYAVRILNPTSRRVEAVISVDGRDAITGRVADFVHHHGYVIRPFGSVTVTGFRKSLDQVAAFRFTSPGDSYSSRMGTPGNVGVIGVAFFTERKREPIAFVQPRRSTHTRPPLPRAMPPAGRSVPYRPRGAAAAAAPKGKSRSRAARDRNFELAPRRSIDNLGTRYGESRFSPVRRVSFRRATPGSPARVILLRYDDEQGLEARGIQIYPPRRWRPRPVAPQAFPNSQGFAPPPPS